MKSFLSSGSHSLDVLNLCLLESTHKACICYISKAMQLQPVSNQFYCRLTFHPSCIVQAVLEFKTCAWLTWLDLVCLIKLGNTREQQGRLGSFWFLICPNCLVLRMLLTLWDVNDSSGGDVLGVNVLSGLQAVGRWLWASAQCCSSADLGPQSALPWKVRPACTVVKILAE